MMYERCDSVGNIHRNPVKKAFHISPTDTIFEAKEENIISVKETIC